LLDEVKNGKGKEVAVYFRLLFKIMVPKVHRDIGLKKDRRLFIGLKIELDIIMNLKGKIWL
jgi:hypothetical protein